MTVEACIRPPELNVLILIYIRLDLAQDYAQVGMQEKQPWLPPKHLLLLSSGIVIAPNLAMVGGVDAFELQNDTSITATCVKHHNKDLTSHHGGRGMTAMAAIVGMCVFSPPTFHQDTSCIRCPPTPKPPQSQPLSNPISPSIICRWECSK